MKQEKPLKRNYKEDEVIEILNDASLNNYTNEQIAIKYNVSVVTVGNWQKRFGCYNRFHSNLGKLILCKNQFNIQIENILKEFNNNIDQLIRNTGQKINETKKHKI